MKKDVKYRIKKYQGRYFIQVWAYEEKGILWWKRKVYDWYDTNSWGRVWNIEPIVEPWDEFKTIKKARKKIKLWLTTTVYYNA